MLRYYFHLNPDELTDDEWAARWEELQWIREQEKKTSIL